MIFYLYPETTTFTIIEGIPVDYTEIFPNEESDTYSKGLKFESYDIKNTQHNGSNSFDGEDQQTRNYDQSQHLASPNNVPIEDVISAKINNNFETNFPSSIKMYNDIVLPTKESALAELRSAAATSPTGEIISLNVL